MAQEFSPTEIFKRATAATLRAIAERDDVTVGFGPEAAGASGARIRLPNPPRDLPADEAAQLRGAADSLALRLRYHDDGVHSRRGAWRPVGARGLRGGRAGAGRGAGRAAHGRRRRQPRGDARRAVSPPGLRAHHRAQREHDGRGGAAADPRGVDPRAAAACRAQGRRSVAAVARAAHRPRPGRARPRDIRPGRLCAA